jgi:beta-N-acetylhexosaminidase
MALGIGDDIERTEDVYYGIGEKLRALGFNTCFAPSLDVNSEAANPVIGTRAFGVTTESVTRHGKAALAGLRESGVATCIKHFPGHGATRTDSHLTLPKVDADRATLEGRELEPFRTVLESETGADMVMTAHVSYPAWDRSGTPATLSESVIGGVLRRDLAYPGLVITDSMEMQGITDRVGPEQAAVEALKAGADLLLYAMDPKMADAAYLGVTRAVESGKITQDRVMQSVEKSFRLRRRLQEKPWLSDDEAFDVLDYKHEPAFFEAARKGLVLEGNAGVLAQIAGASGRKLIVLPRRLDPYRSLSLEVVREALDPMGFEMVEVEPRPSDDEIALAAGKAAEASVVVVGIASRGPMAPENERLVKAVTARDVIKVGVALLDPGDADRMMTANCRIKTYGFGVPHLWAMCQELLG